MDITDEQLEERSMQLLRESEAKRKLPEYSEGTFIEITLDRLRDARESLRLLEKARRIMEARGYPTLDIDTHIDHLKKLLNYK